MRNVVTTRLGNAGGAAGLGALLDLIWAANVVAQSGAAFINDKMIAETASFDPDHLEPGVAENLPTHGDRVSLAAQNRGILFYGGKHIANYNRANRRVTRSAAI